MKQSSQESNRDPENKVSENLQKNKIKVQVYIDKIISELQPLDGSIAEKYLKHTRKLQRLPQTPSLQFHPNLSTRSKSNSWINNIPGLVALASHPRSSSGNIQITYLDPAHPRKLEDANISRQTFGTFHSDQGHHFCQLVKNSSTNYSFVCEGVETGLSVFQAFPDSHLIATLGKNNFSRLDPEVLNKKVVLVMDNDGIPLSSDRIFKETTQKLIDHGKDVYYILPPLIDGLDKTDINDVLVHYGEDGVHHLISTKLQKLKK